MTVSPSNHPHPDCEQAEIESVELPVQQLGRQ